MRYDVYMSDEKYRIIQSVYAEFMVHLHTILFRFVNWSSCWLMLSKRDVTMSSRVVEYSLITRERQLLPLGSLVYSHTSC